MEAEKLRGDVCGESSVVGLRAAEILLEETVVGLSVTLKVLGCSCEEPLERGLEDRAECPEISLVEAGAGIDGGIHASPCLGAHVERVGHLGDRGLGAGLCAERSDRLGRCRSLWRGGLVRGEPAAQGMGLARGEPASAPGGRC